jgi:hypothetical protein
MLERAKSVKSSIFFCEFQKTSENFIFIVCVGLNHYILEIFTSMALKKYVFLLWPFFRIYVYDLKIKISFIYDLPSNSGQNTSFFYGHFFRTYLYDLKTKIPFIYDLLSNSGQ